MLTKILPSIKAHDTNETSSHHTIYHTLTSIISQDITFPRRNIWKILYIPRPQNRNRPLTDDSKSSHKLEYTTHCLCIAYFHALPECLRKVSNNDRRGRWKYQNTVLPSCHVVATNFHILPSTIMPGRNGNSLTP